MSNARWIPLESNPKVFDSWAHAAGLVKSQAHFEDVYGLDDSLLQMVPLGVKAVCLCFPIADEIENRAREEDSKIKEAEQHSVDPTIFWMKQTIPNACGTMALIHALANSDIVLVPESPLTQFIEECKDKTPLERASLLQTTPLFDSIHQSAAHSGQTDAATADMHTNLHFTTFVRAPPASVRAAAGAVAKEQTEVASTGAGAQGAEGGEKQALRLIELDGRRAGPIDRGECTDLLRDAARHIRNLVCRSESIQFGMLALCPGSPPPE